MERENMIVGLEIGTSKIVAIAGRKNDFGKIDILGMAKTVSDGIGLGYLTETERTVDAILHVVKQLEDEASIKISAVNVGVSGQYLHGAQHTASIVREYPQEKVSEEDVKLLWDEMYKIDIPAGSQIIHIMPQEYFIDFQGGVKNPIGMIGRRMEADFNVLTVNTKAIQALERCVLQTSLQINELVFAPVASSLAVLEEEKKETGVVLVDIGGAKTDVTVFFDGSIRHHAIIPVGGDSVTSDIKQGFSVMQDQAEMLKTKFGYALSNFTGHHDVISIPDFRNRPPKEISSKNLAIVIEARMEEIAEMVLAQIKQSGLKERLQNGIILTGGGSQLQNVRQLFEKMTGMKTKIGYPNKEIENSKPDGMENPMYAMAIGLLLAGFKTTEMEIA
jgi:cell division protein FtsA